MKIVFFGSAHFAVPALEALIKSKHEVVCVVTQPDKKK
ncbi:MAG: methionyl-tRNA formyltransferase, partial [Candidatus Omnitrophota bacterium]|nr:methionyl-tRNA formyltransferase [Candidatus Omnitrophota bacterium]